MGSEEISGDLALVGWDRIRPKKKKKKRHFLGLGNGKKIEGGRKVFFSHVVF